MKDLRDIKDLTIHDVKQTAGASLGSNVLRVPAGRRAGHPPRSLAPALAGAAIAPGKVLSSLQGCFAYSRPIEFCITQLDARA